MEEVWKDIHQSSIQENNPKISSKSFFEDILNNRPSSIIVPQSEKEFKENNVIVDDDDVVIDDDKNGIFKKELLMNSQGFMSPFEALATNTVVSSTSPASSLLNTSCFPIIPSNKNKRPLSENHHDFCDGETGVDRRHKRMIKNRESAARSRARRQAYTSELERERDELKQENAMLRKQQEQQQQQEQQEQLLLSTPAQVQKKRTHNRSHTV